MYDEASKVVFNSPRRWETTSHSKGQAWANSNTIKTITVKPDELAPAVMRLAMEGEPDPIRLHDGSLEGLLPAAAWREAS